MVKKKGIATAIPFLVPITSIKKINLRINLLLDFNSGLQLNNLKRVDVGSYPTIKL